MIVQYRGGGSCLHMTRVGTIPVDLVIPDLNVEQRYIMMVIKIETMIVGADMFKGSVKTVNFLLKLN